MRIESSQPIEEAILGDAQAELTGPAPPAGTHRALLKVQSQGDPLFLSITCRNGGQRPAVFSDGIVPRWGRRRPITSSSVSKLILPWAPAAELPRRRRLWLSPTSSGGDPARGKTIFNGEQARCSQCHAFRGQGGKVGPDLTEIGKKGRAEIYRAIAAPSASIEPEFTVVFGGDQERTGRRWGRPCRRGRRDPGHRYQRPRHVDPAPWRSSRSAPVRIRSCRSA